MKACSPENQSHPRLKEGSPQKGFTRGFAGDYPLLFSFFFVQSQSVVDKYSGADGDVGVMDEKDLICFIPSKEQLQQHV
ncbi:hypothetical protein ACFX2A_041254 [Malus domestica]